ncbi:MAG: 3-keto-disaccharide hydrolase [Candidatus Cyclobacteriaceae bacterium M2_1C_046]
MKFILLSSLCLSLLSAALMAQEKPNWTPEHTEKWEPEPAKIDPGTAASPPSDAIVLFEGNDLSEWESVKDGEAKWTMNDGFMTVNPGAGDIRTKKKFGDIQLHLEWKTPEKVKGEGQGRGNSGVFLQERYEVQILDSYNNRTYSNGQAGSIYKQHIPLVNASKRPDEWQTYDIIYTAPVFDEDGSVKYPARVTVLHNGVVIQNNVLIEGKTEYIGLPEYEAHGDGAIILQDHGDLVSYRNIWVREL